MKIVSGGQSGADRAALDLAMEFGLEVGGWVPRAPTAEDGRIPDCYPGLAQTGGGDPAEWMRRNVRDADATLIISRGEPKDGPLLMLDEARRLGKPVLPVNLELLSLSSAAERVSVWLRSHHPNVLNVVGQQASEDGDFYEAVESLLSLVLTPHRNCLSVGQSDRGVAEFASNRSDPRWA